ncbi:MAG: hypothetical protein NTY34_00360 [Candidatus Omnitrophica bacterium]|nr:hypothetical protein [Candidatus Omnitrophota bacterium]
MNAWQARRKAPQSGDVEEVLSRGSLSTREELGARSLIMDLQSPRNKKWIRSIALVLVVCFINQDLVWAQEGTPVWSKGQGHSTGSGPGGNFAVKTQAVTPQGGIAIPKDVAVTKEVYKSTNGDARTVINIQDAHASLAAQESIASILDSLVTNYDLKLVAIEGSKGYIDTSLLKTFPDENIRKNTANYFMKKGKLSAGEFFSITSDKEISLYGIEDKRLYLENVEQFRKIQEINESTKKDIANLTAALENLKEKIYSKDLLLLDKNSVLHRDGKITFSERWDLVSKLAATQGVTYEKYENLSKLVESLKLEKKIDFQKANKERDALIDILSKKMVKTDLEQLVLRSLSFKQGKVSQGEYYLYLQELARHYGVDPEPYKGLITYTEYITLYESIDLVEIFEEVRKFEDSIKEKILKDDYQRKLHGFSRFVSLVSTLYELKLTGADTGELISYIPSLRGREAAEAISKGGIASLPSVARNDKELSISAETLAAFIKSASLKYGVAIEGGYDLGAIFAEIEPALSFYRTAEERNAAMLANTINEMQKNGQSVAALVTGGYHTKGLTEILKQRETSYLVILPKFDSSKGDRPYVAILTNKKEPYEKLLQTGDYYLATTSFFATQDNFNNAADIRAFIKELVLVAMAQAVLEEKNPKSVAEIWLNAYEGRQKQLGLRDSEVLFTRKELEGLIGSVEILTIEKGKTAVASIPTVSLRGEIGKEALYLKVVRAADETGVDIGVPTSGELASLIAAKKTLENRRPVVKPDDLEDRVARLEQETEKLKKYIKTQGPQDEALIIARLKEAGLFQYLVGQFEGQPADKITGDSLIAKLRAKGVRVRDFEGSAEVYGEVNSLLERVKAASASQLAITELATGGLITAARQRAIELAIGVDGKADILQVPPAVPVAPAPAPAAEAEASEAQRALILACLTEPLNENYKRLIDIFTTRKQTRSISDKELVIIDEKLKTALAGQLSGILPGNPAVAENLIDDESFRIFKNALQAELNKIRSLVRGLVEMCKDLPDDEVPEVVQELKGVYEPVDPGEGVPIDVGRLVDKMLGDRQITFALALLRNIDRMARAGRREEAIESMKKFDSFFPSDSDAMKDPGVMAERGRIRTLLNIDEGIYIREKPGKGPGLKGTINLLWLGAGITFLYHMVKSATPALAETGQGVQAIMGSGIHEGARAGLAAISTGNLAVAIFVAVAAFLICMEDFGISKRKQPAPLFPAGKTMLTGQPLEWQTPKFLSLDNTLGIINFIGIMAVAECAIGAGIGLLGFWTAIGVSFAFELVIIKTIARYTSLIDLKKHPFLNMAIAILYNKIFSKVFIGAAALLLINMARPPTQGEEIRAMVYTGQSRPMWNSIYRIVMFIALNFFIYAFLVVLGRAIRKWKKEPLPESNVNEKDRSFYRRLNLFLGIGNISIPAIILMLFWQRYVRILPAAFRIAVLSLGTVVLLMMSLSALKSYFSNRKAWAMVELSERIITSRRDRPVDWLLRGLMRRSKIGAGISLEEADKANTNLRLIAIALDELARKLRLGGEWAVDAVIAKANSVWNRFDGMKALEKADDKDAIKLLVRNRAKLGSLIYKKTASNLDRINASIGGIFGAGILARAIYERLIRGETPLHEPGVIQAGIGNNLLVLFAVLAAVVTAIVIVVKKLKGTAKQIGTVKEENAATKNARRRIRGASTAIENAKRRGEILREAQAKLLVDSLYACLVPGMPLDVADDLKGAVREVERACGKTLTSAVPAEKPKEKPGRTVQSAILATGLGMKVLSVLNVLNLDPAAAALFGIIGLALAAVATMSFAFTNRANILLFFAPPVPARGPPGARRPEAARQPGRAAQPQPSAITPRQISTSKPTFIQEIPLESRAARPSDPQQAAFYNALKERGMTISKGQLAAIIENTEAIEEGRKMVFDHAATGGGKTVIGYGTAYLWVAGERGRRAFVATAKDYDSKDNAEEAQNVFLTDALKDKKIRVAYITGGEGKRGEGRVANIYDYDTGGWREVPESRAYEDAQVIYADETYHRFFLQSKEGVRFARAPEHLGRVLMIHDEADNTRVLNRTPCVISGDLKPEAAAEVKDMEFVHANILAELGMRGEPAIKRSTHYFKSDDDSSRTTLDWIFGYRKLLALVFFKYRAQMKHRPFSEWRRTVETALTAQNNYLPDTAPVPDNGRHFKFYKVDRVYGDVVSIENGDPKYGQELPGGLHDSLRIIARTADPSLSGVIEPRGSRQTISRLTVESSDALPCMRATVLMTATGREALGQLYPDLKYVAVESAFPDNRIVNAPVFTDTDPNKWKAMIGEIGRHLSGPQLIDVRHEDIGIVEQKLREAFGSRVEVVVYKGTLPEGQRTDIIANAGKPGRITLIDDTLTRGVTIKLLEEASRQEGLHLYLTHIKLFKILIDQLIGRVGRQGLPGTVHQFYSKEDLRKLGLLVSEKIRENLVEPLMRRLGRPIPGSGGVYEDTVPGGRRKFEDLEGLSGIEEEIFGRDRILDTHLAETMSSHRREISRDGRIYDAADKIFEEMAADPERTAKEALEMINSPRSLELIRRRAVLIKRSSVERSLAELFTSSIFYGLDDPQRQAFVRAITQLIERERIEEAAVKIRSRIREAVILLVGPRVDRARTGYITAAEEMKDDGATEIERSADQTKDASLTGAAKARFEGERKNVATMLKASALEMLGGEIEDKRAQQKEITVLPGKARVARVSVYGGLTSLYYYYIYQGIISPLLSSGGLGRSVEGLFSFLPAISGLGPAVLTVITFTAIILVLTLRSSYLKRIAQMNVADIRMKCVLTGQEPALKEPLLFGNYLLYKHFLNPVAFMTLPVALVLMLSATSPLMLGLVGMTVTQALVAAAFSGVSGLIASLLIMVVYGRQKVPGSEKEEPPLVWAEKSVKGYKINLASISRGAALVIAAKILYPALISGGMMSVLIAPVIVLGAVLASHLLLKRFFAVQKGGGIESKTFFGGRSSLLGYAIGAGLAVTVLSIALSASGGVALYAGIAGLIMTGAYALSGAMQFAGQSKSVVTRAGVGRKYLGEKGFANIILGVIENASMNLIMLAPVILTIAQFNIKSFFIASVAPSALALSGYILAPLFLLIGVYLILAYKDIVPMVRSKKVMAALGIASAGSVALGAYRQNIQAATASQQALEDYFTRLEEKLGPSRGVSPEVVARRDRLVAQAYRDLTAEAQKSVTISTDAIIGKIASERFNQALQPYLDSYNAASAAANTALAQKDKPDFKKAQEEFGKAAAALAGINNIDPNLMKFTEITEPKGFVLALNRAARYIAGVARVSPDRVPFGVIRKNITIAEQIAKLNKQKDDIAKEARLFPYREQYKEGVNNVTAAFSGEGLPDFAAIDSAFTKAAGALIEINKIDPKIVTEEQIGNLKKKQEAYSKLAKFATPEGGMAAVGPAAGPGPGAGAPPPPPEDKAATQAAAIPGAPGMAAQAIAAASMGQLPSTTDQPDIKFAVTPEMAGVIAQNASYFAYDIGVDRATGLPYNHIVLSGNSISSTGAYCNPTDIGLYLDIMASVANGKIKMKSVTPQEALGRIKKALGTLLNIQKRAADNWKGLFSWYQFRGGNAVRDEASKVSAVDNANLCWSLAAVIGALQGDPANKGIVNAANDIINAQASGWADLYDSDKGLMRAGYDLTGRGYLTYWLDRRYNESRTATAWAILHSNGKVPVSAFTNMKYPSNPEQYATSDGKNITGRMSWDGAIFQALMPLLWIDENRISPDSYARAHRDTVEVQIDHAMKTKKLPALLSTSYGTDGNYRAYGVPALAETVVSFGNKNQVFDDVASPHTLALAALVDYDRASGLITNLEKKHPKIKTPYGWRDGINARGETSDTICAIDQGMLVLALLGPTNSGYVSAYLNNVEGRMDQLYWIYGAKRPVAETKPKTEVKAAAETRPSAETEPAAAARAAPKTIGFTTLPKDIAQRLGANLLDNMDRFSGTITPEKKEGVFQMPAAEHGWTGTTVGNKNLTGFKYAYIEVRNTGGEDKTFKLELKGIFDGKKVVRLPNDDKWHLIPIELPGDAASPLGYFAISDILSAFELRGVYFSKETIEIAAPEVQRVPKPQAKPAAASATTATASDAATPAPAVTSAPATQPAPKPAVKKKPVEQGARPTTWEAAPAPAPAATSEKVREDIRSLFVSAGAALDAADKALDARDAAGASKSISAASGKFGELVSLWQLNEPVEEKALKDLQDRVLDTAARRSKEAERERSISGWLGSVPQQLQWAAELLPPPAKPEPKVAEPEPVERGLNMLCIAGFSLLPNRDLETSVSPISNDLGSRGYKVSLIKPGDHIFPDGFGESGGHYVGEEAYMEWYESHDPVVLIGTGASSDDVMGAAKKFIELGGRAADIFIVLVDGNADYVKSLPDGVKVLSFHSAASGEFGPIKGAAKNIRIEGVSHRDIIKDNAVVRGKIVYELYAALEEREPRPVRKAPAAPVKIAENILGLIADADVALKMARVELAKNEAGKNRARIYIKKAEDALNNLKKLKAEEKYISALGARIAAFNRPAAIEQDDKMARRDPVVAQVEVSEIAGIIGSAFRKYAYSDTAAGSKEGAYLSMDSLAGELALDMRYYLDFQRDKDGKSITAQDVREAAGIALSEWLARNPEAGNDLPGIIADLITEETGVILRTLYIDVPGSEAEAAADNIAARAAGMTGKISAGIVGNVASALTAKRPAQPPVMEIRRPLKARSPKGRNNEYDIKYNDWRLMAYTFGEGAGARDGARYGLFGAGHIKYGSGDEWFQPRDIPEAVMTRRDGFWKGCKRLLFKEDIQALKDKGWEFYSPEEEPHISYENMTAAGIFMASLENIDNYTRMNEIAKQLGIVLTADDKFHLDLIAQASLPGGVSGGVQLWFYLKNPAKEVNEEISSQKENLQKFVRCDYVQKMLNNIYGLRTAHREASARLKNMENFKAEFEEIAKLAEANKTIERAGFKIESTRKMIDDAIRTETDKIIDARTALNKIMRRAPEAPFTLSEEEFVEWDSPESKKRADVLEKQITDNMGMAQASFASEVGLAKAHKNLGDLGYALAKARKELSILLGISIMYGSDSGASSGFMLEFRRDKKTDLMVSRLGAFNAIAALKNTEEMAVVRSAVLAKRLDAIREELDFLNKKLAPATLKIKEAEAERYKTTGDKEGQPQVQVADVNAAYAAYFSILDTIAQAQAEIENIERETSTLKNSLTVKTKEMEDKFKTKDSLIEALVKAGQAEMRKLDATQVTHISQDPLSEIDAGIKNSAQVLALVNEETAAKRAMQAVLAQIPQAKKFKALLKEREELEAAYYEEYEKSPNEDTVKRFMAKSRELEKKIDVIMNNLLDFVNKTVEGKQATLVGQNWLEKLFNVRKTVKCEAVDIEGSLPSGGLSLKLKLLIGKEYYGEVRLLNLAWQKAQNRTVSARNTVAHNIVTALNQMRHTRLYLAGENSRLKESEAAARRIVERIAEWESRPDSGERTEELKKLKENMAKEEARGAEISINVTRAKTRFSELEISYKTLLGVDQKTVIDVSVIIDSSDDKFRDAVMFALFDKEKGRFDKRQLNKERQINIDILRAIDYMANEDIPIPIEIFIGMTGAGIYAELFNGDKRRQVVIGRKESAGALKRGLEAYKDEGAGLYNSKLNAVDEKDIALELAGLFRGKIEKAVLDVENGPREESAYDADIDSLSRKADYFRTVQDEESAFANHLNASIVASELDDPEIKGKDTRTTIRVPGLNNLTMKDKSAAIEVMTAKEVLSAEKAAFFYRPLSVYGFAVIGYGAQGAYVSGGGGAASGIPDTGSSGKLGPYGPIIGPSGVPGGGSGGGPGAIPGGGSGSGSGASASKGGGGGGSSIAFNVGLNFEYEIKKLLSQDLPKAKEKLKLSKFAEAKANGDKTVIARSMAANIMSEVNMLDLAKRQKQRASDDKLRVAGLSDSSLKGIRKLGGMEDVSAEADVFVRISEKRSNQARLGYQTAAGETNADVIMTQTQKETMALSPEMRDLVAPFASRDPRIRILEK